LRYLAAIRPVKPMKANDIRPVVISEIEESLNRAGTLATVNAVEDCCRKCVAGVIAGQ